MINLPDYKDGGIVNLMSSIEGALGGNPLYAPLKTLKPKEIKSFKNVVLIVIDGLGHEYLKKHGEGTVFQKYFRSSITSVFPSTTATGITTFMTGVAPQQHAVTGWFVLLKEMGTVSTILPFTPRYKGKSFGSVINPKIIFNVKPFVKKINANTFSLHPHSISDSDYTLAHMDKAKRISYKGVDGFFNSIMKVIRQRKKSKKNKFIYAYWPDFDTIEHHFGPKSSKVKKHFTMLNKKLTSFIKKIDGTNTLLIVTADHGQIDIPPRSRIELKKHPKLEETLTLPLCGEPRAAYCYVHPSKAKQFEHYTRTRLRKYCWVFKSEDLIRKNWFGLYKPNQKLFERVGDYVLVMKKNYALKDFLMSENKRFLLGNHGGVSKEEMFVPLIVIKKD
jgi:predicted AlkP superfamily pyrophosphatase or phosphodiesterase